MKNFNISKKKVEALGNGVFLIGLGILFYTGAWWPGILLAIWASLAIRQWLSNRSFDLVISSVILLGLFLVSFLELKWNVLVPVLFFLGGLYIIFREFYYSENSTDDQTKDISNDTDLNKRR